MGDGAAEGVEDGFELARAVAFGGFGDTAVGEKKDQKPLRGGGLADRAVMARRPRVALGGLAYHVMNGGAGRQDLFEDAADCAAFERVLAEARKRERMRLCAYAMWDRNGDAGECH